MGQTIPRWPNIVSNTQVVTLSGKHNIVSMGGSAAVDRAIAVAAPRITRQALKQRIAPFVASSPGNYIWVTGSRPVVWPTVK